MLSISVLRRLATCGAATAAVTLAAAAPAVGADLVSLPTVHRTLGASAAFQRADCATSALGTGRSVASTSWTADQPLSYAVQLSGPAGSDWDLAVIDHASGRVVGGSAGFGDSELVTGLAGTGRRLDIQACRVSGPATSVDLTILSVAVPEVPASIPSLTPQLSGRETRSASTRAVAASNLPSGRTEYRHLADVQADLKKLVQDYPAIVRPVTLPKKTYQGRDTIGVEISSDVARPDDQKPTSFIMGTHHAREWPAADVTTEFAIYLAKGFGTDDEITQLLQHVRVVVVPVINGDGYNASREAPDPADSTGDPGGAPSLAESVAVGGSLAYRRKNCHGPDDNPATPCDATNGVDPNRNYGFNWGGPGASSSPNSQSYRGSGPWSEPETQAVHEFSQVRDVTTLLTMHNFASLVLRPPGLQVDGKAPDEDRLKVLGDAMASDTGYTSEYSYQLYDTAGTTEDWNYGAAGTFGYTMELGPEAGDGGNFHVSYDRAVVDQWNGTGVRAGRGVRKALLRVAGSAAVRQDFSTLEGRAPAGRTLRLHKSFKTSTSPVCQIASPSDVNPGAVDSSCINPGDPILIDDKLDYTTRIPANGAFNWIVTPSTRPFVLKKGGSESWTLTCEDDAGTVYNTRSITIGRGETQTIDLPCGATLPPKPAAAPLPAALVDRLAPESTFTRRSLKASRTRISLSGSSSDKAPAGLTPRVAKVLVTIGRRTGKLCRFLTAAGTFGPKTSCHRTKYVVARVTAPKSSVRWSYVLGKALPVGRYLAWARGVDASGNVELKHKPRNLATFRIR